MKRTHIYLVCEDGTGIIHAGFPTEEDAQSYADFLTDTEEMECFRVLRCIWQPQYDIVKPQS